LISLQIFLYEFEKHFSFKRSRDILQFNKSRDMFNIVIICDVNQRVNDGAFDSYELTFCTWRTCFRYNDRCL